MTASPGNDLRASMPGLVRSVGLATVIPVALGVVSAPLLARAMDPQDRGRLAGILAACTITTVLALGGSSQQLPKRLASLPIEAVWPHVRSEIRRLQSGLVLFSVGLVLVSAVVWPASISQLALVTAIVATSWLLGMTRGTLVGVHQHGKATSTFLFESILRVAGVLTLVVVWRHVETPLALLATGLVPPLVTLAWFAPGMLRLRAAAQQQSSPITTQPEQREISAVRIALAQQFMGRSILAVWAITLSDAQVGVIVVAFAVTEMTVNFARIAQPHVIHQAEAGHPRPTPWLVLIGLATVASALGGWFLIVPLFGAEYSAATSVVVPLAIAQGLFATTIILTGIRFVTDRNGSIVSVQYWQAATVIVSTAAGIVGSAVWVAVAFSMMALGQTITGALWIRRSAPEASARPDRHAA